MSSPNDLHGLHPGGTDGSGEGEKIQVPNNVVIAFWTWIASAVLSLVDLVLHFPSKQDMLAATRQLDTGGLTQQQIEQAASIAVVVGIVLSIVVALLYVLFAWKMRSGKNWARVTLTLLTAFQVIMALGVGGGGWIALAICCLGVLAMYLPSSNAYFLAVRKRRSAPNP